MAVYLIGGGGWLANFVGTDFFLISWIASVEFFSSKTKAKLCTFVTIEIFNSAKDAWGCGSSSYNGSKNVSWFPNVSCFWGNAVKTMLKNLFCVVMYHIYNIVLKEIKRLKGVLGPPQTSTKYCNSRHFWLVGVFQYQVTTRWKTAHYEIDNTCTWEHSPRFSALIPLFISAVCGLGTRGIRAEHIGLLRSEK